MENKPKKSKAFIITFILVLIILLVGYLLLKNRNGIFQINNTEKTNKQFETLTETKEAKDIGYISVDSTNECISISVIAEEDIFKGEVVYVSGVSKENQPFVRKAIANDQAKSKVIGMAMANILTGTTGLIANNCLVTGLNTDRNEGTNWKVGDTLYLSDTTPGALTKNAPSNKVVVGYVNTISAIDGSIQVGGAGTNVFNLAQAIKDAGIDTSKGIVYAIERLKEIFSSIFGYEYSGSEFDENGLGEWLWDNELGEFVWKWKGGGGGFNGPDFPGYDPMEFKKVCENEKDDDGDGLKDEADPQCHIDGILTNEYIPTHYSESVNAIDPNGENDNLFVCNNRGDDDGDGLTDEADPQCHVGGILTNKYIPTHYSEEINAIDSNVDSDGTNDGNDEDVIPTPDDVCKNGATNYPVCTTGANGQCLNEATNPPLCTEYNNEEDEEDTNPAEMCKVFYSNPLTFTDTEQADLDKLLRKFYVMAPKLRNEDDIYNVYNQVEKYLAFNEQIDELTDQCYAQKSDPSYLGPKTSYGNPWYRYSERGSYLSAYSNTNNNSPAVNTETVKAGENIKSGDFVYVFDSDPSSGLFVVKKWYDGIPPTCGGSMNVCIPKMLYGTASENILSGQTGKITTINLNLGSFEDVNNDLGSLNCSLGGDCTGVINKNLLEDLEILLNIW